MAYAYEITQLSPSARTQAERAARAVLRSLEAGWSGTDPGHVIDAIRDEISGRCGVSQYDDGPGQDRWWAMREVAEAIVWKAHPEWEPSAPDAPATPFQPVWIELPDGVSEIVGA